MIEKYLITFTPVNRFYFGTSKSFAEDFYTVSSRFPTQTTALGVLRRTILKQHNLLDAKGLYPKREKDEIVKDVFNLTGTSLMKELDEEINEFGMIRKISPLFIVENIIGTETPKDFFFQSPSNIVKDKDEKYVRPMRIKYCEHVQRSNSCKKTDNAYLVEEDSKVEKPEFLAGRDFWCDYLDGKEKYDCNYKNYEDVFVNDSQPGIGREENGFNPSRIVEDNKFYFKNDYRMKESFSFGIIVHFESNNILQNDEVFMGGERSIFQMRLQKIEPSNEYLFKDHPIVKLLLDENYRDTHPFEEGKGLCFLSPLCAKESIMGIDYSIVKGLYSPRTTSASKLKSDSYSMYPSGSVFFPNEVFRGWVTYNALSKIGYNWAIKFNRGF